MKAITISSCSPASPIESPDRFGTQGSPISLSTACSSGATAIQLGIEAIRRGETDAALCIGTDGSVHAEALIRFSLLSALSTQNESGASREAVFKEPRRLHHGGGRRSARDRKLRGGCARRENSRHDRGRRRPRATASIAPALARTASRSSLHAMQSRMQASRPTPSTTSMRMAQHARERQDGVISAAAVMGERMKSAADLLQQVDDRPHFDGGRSGRGRVLVADSRQSAHSADHQPQRSGSGDPA